jgi:hypothetical protein
MAPKNIFHTIDLRVSLLSVVYLLICISHLFFVPKVNHQTHNTHSSIFRRKTEDESFVQRTDKVTVDEHDKSISKIIENNSRLYNLLLFSANSYLPNLYPTLPKREIFYRHYYSYLYCRVIKI